MKAFLGADDRYLKGRCHGYQFCEKWQKLHFRRSGIHKRMGYRYLKVHINSVNDASISCKNFVNFGQVTPDQLT